MTEVQEVTDAPLRWFKQGMKPLVDSYAYGR